MKSKWMKCCAVLMGVLLAVSPLTALAEEPQNPAATAREKTVNTGIIVQEDTAEEGESIEQSQEMVSGAESIEDGIISVEDDGNLDIGKLSNNIVTAIKNAVDQADIKVNIVNSPYDWEQRRMIPLQVKKQCLAR